MLFLEVEWVIVKILSLATPTRPYVITIFQVWGMIWWQLLTLVRYVGFRKLDGSDLEGLVLDIDLLRYKSNLSINFATDVDLLRRNHNSSNNLVILLRQAGAYSGEVIL